MTKFLQLTVSGLSLGALYALVALGFVVVLKATRVFNLFQGAFVLVGSYLAYTAHRTWGLPFWVAVVVALALCAGLGVAVEAAVLRRLRPGDLSTPVLVTVGLLTITEPIVEAIWGSDSVLDLGDPWGIRTVSLGSVVVAQRDLWVLLVAALAMGAFFVLFRFTAIGRAMRAVAADREAAVAQGIDPRTAVRVSWALAGGLGALAGLMASTAVGGGVRTSVVVLAFAAIPGLILGGFDSPVGAVAGSLVVGLAQQYTAGYTGDILNGQLGTVVPYVVLLVVLLVRPTGLLGSAALRRA
jgi:branched-chain amino acid transport system permease protein